MNKMLIIISLLFSSMVYSQEYNFNIPMENKPHEVIKFSAEQGKTYNWDRCSGQTTQVLSEDGIACEKVYNAKEGFTGSVDVCVTSTKDYLSDPYCFAMCQGETVSWNNCTANVGLSEHLEIKEITNTDNRYVGTAELLCTDGAWSIKSSNCEDNLAVCGTDHNTTNDSPINLCEIGQASSVTSNQNTMNWSCTTTASNASCSSYKVAVCDTNTFNGCSVGSSGGYTSNISDTTATWTCSNGSSNVNCTKTKLAGINGVCGIINGQTVASQPIINLCSSGIASVVTTNPTTHTWSCAGTVLSNTQLGGTSSNCSANREPICAAGLTWNGTSCVGTQTQSATATCPSGGSASGSSCYSTSTYSAYKCAYGTTYNGSMCVGQKHEQMVSGSGICPSGYEYFDWDYDGCRKFENGKYVYAAVSGYNCPSGWTSGYYCTRYVQVTEPREYIGCGNDWESNGICYKDYRTGSVVYTCNSGWSLSGSTCSKSTTQIPIGYK